MRLPLPLIDTTGASAAAPVPTYNPDTDELEFAAGGGGGGVVDSVVAGTGISVDSTDPANPIVSATGGGGTVKDRAWSVGSSETSTDEHNDSALAAGWTRVDGTGAAAANATWTEDADVLSAYNAGADSSGVLHALLLPLTSAGGSIASGDAFVTSMTLCGPPATNYTYGGLILADGTTHGAGNQITAETSISSTATNTFAATWTNFTSRGTLAGALNMALIKQRYTRLVYLGSNTWRADVSPDGVSWIKGGTVSKTITPTHVGYLSTSWGTATKSVIAYEFLRRVSGVT